MGFWILIILGIIQGLTEFLPVSSSGHLVVLYAIFGIEDNTVILSILLHLATLLAVLIYYRKDIWILITHPLCHTNRKLLVTTIFTCLVVLAIKPIIDLGFGGDYISIFFVITGILLIVSDIVANKKKKIGVIENTSTINYSEYMQNLPLTYTQAIIIGVSQGIACIPGISRSGTTIATSRILGCDQISAKYSFLISIPIIIGSLLLEIIDGATLAGVNIPGIIVAFVLCFVVGLLCIKVMVEFVKRCKLQYFSYYLFALSTFLILNSLFFHLF